MKITLWSIAVLSVLLISAGCKSNNSDNNDDGFDGTGTVRYIYLEGGFYAIVDDTGENYQPVNLPEEFKIDGLRVQYNFLTRPDLASIYLWGIAIEILDIQYAPE